MAGAVEAVARPSCAATSHVSEGAQPPKRRDIDAFMVKYSAHLPHLVFDDEGRTPTNGLRLPVVSSRFMAPYLYTGVDYALVLAACFPARCIDLASLNWSSTPLASQRLGNLRVFCEAARALALPDAPLSALQAELLQCSPACVVAHLKVQHWLYSLSLRFVPHGDHDAATLRAVHRHLQLGEPYLKRQRTELGQRYDTCPSVHECAPFSAKDLQRCCGPVLAPVPPFIEVPVASAQPGPSSSNSRRGGKENDIISTAAGGTDRSSKSDDEEGGGALRMAKQKPWLNYSKPWLLPSLRAAEAKKAASEAAAAKQEQEERERNPRYNAFVAQSTDVNQQYMLSRAAAAEKRDQLRVVKAFIVEEITEGKPLDFKELVDRLRGQR
ncbi:hypothetical protein ABB37_07559 [Leptomonas pyrrhocoris]|uniref:Uncharacterized protein n=1 Tax=Leptomonas pyrrhocoris TaxID=157538 RepID=A0A0M9FVD4_LEPPY|nr:hypothetical protein ABB37_07559 [Leptomonas pyrrhocoris]KPA76727.1 hypothetical protein ABB37_07559 [Leptomonas pyrrhocoris]|eukprot:XP_015655166.1 hypothetical protein ABB37_07559 [Leptomonas pyrrhocoris]